jgi:hypothetical protein
MAIADRPSRSSIVPAEVAYDSVDDVLDELERPAGPAVDISPTRVALVGQLAGHKAGPVSCGPTRVGTFTIHDLPVADGHCWGITRNGWCGSGQSPGSFSRAPRASPHPTEGTD